MLIIVNEGVLFQNHEIPTFQTTNRDVAMTPSYLKTVFQPENTE